jgi:hypothetical protein
MPIIEYDGSWPCSNNIKMYIEKIACEGVDWIELARNRVQ